GHPHPLRRAKDGIYQRRGEDGPTSADISAPRGRVAFALIQAMVLRSSRDAEASLSPALACLYGYDTYITVRTTSLVQNVPRGTLSRFASVPSVPRGTFFEAWPPTIAHSYTWDAAGSPR